MKFSDLSHPYLSTGFIYVNSWYSSYGDACHRQVKPHRRKYWCFQLAQVLHYLHGNEFYHNDLHPSNLGLVYSPHLVRQNLLWQPKQFGFFYWEENFEIQLRNCYEISCNPDDAFNDFGGFILLCLYGGYPYHLPSYEELYHQFIADPRKTIRKSPLDSTYQDCLVRALEKQDWEEVLKHPTWKSFL